MLMMNSSTLANKNGV